MNYTGLALVVSALTLLFGALGSYVGTRIAVAQLQRDQAHTADELAEIRAWKNEDAIPTLARHGEAIGTIREELRELKG